ncbi:MAG: pyrroline-5-carboxylate reductase [Thermotoga sp.]|nr:MAG: pyrroline-5-carboxylate reductase [Thermotoga sp.]
MFVGIIGVGNIGSIIADTLSVDGKNLFLVDRHEYKLQRFAEKGAQTAFDISQLPNYLDVLFIAVKPQDARKLLKELGSVDFNVKYIISTVTGLKISEIDSCFHIPQIVRIMPNIPIAIGKGVVGVAYGDSLSGNDKKFVNELLAPFGKLVEVKEKLFSAVTALSGSGPAFIFVIVEALVDAGMKLGLSYEVSMELILQTLKGSAELLENEQKHPGELRHLVTSPAGTTIEGIYSLEQRGLRGILMQAIQDTYRRACELSDEQKEV